MLYMEVQTGVGVCGIVIATMFSVPLQVEEKSAALVVDTIRYISGIPKKTINIFVPTAQVCDFSFFAKC